MKKAPKKEPFLIDFEAPPPTRSELLASTSKATINLPQSRSRKSKLYGKEAEQEAHLLPDDMHFSSKQLLHMFTKPKFALRMRKSGAGPAPLNDHGEVDAEYWTNAAATAAEGLADDFDPGFNDGVSSLHWSDTSLLTP